MQLKLLHRNSKFLRTLLLGATVQCIIHNGSEPPTGNDSHIVLLVFFHVFLPPPLVLSAAVRPPGGRIGRYSVRPEQARKIRNFLIKHAGDLVDIIHHILPSRDKGDNLESAASTAGLYIFNIPVGTSPPQVVTGVLDIGLSFIWAQCERCSPCLPPPAPTFQWSASPTFSTLPCASDTCQSVLSQTCPGDDDTAGCGYTVTYGDGGGTNTTGYLANDTFTFGPSAVPGVVFGCSLASYGDFSGASGTFGFGRGPLSLVSQLQLSWFSYRLASDDPGSENLLLFGDDDVVPRSKKSRSTRLLRNSMYPDLYYVKLKGIQVGGEDLTGIPAGTFDFQADGSGGVFLSTTSPVTYLEEAAYKVVRQAFVRGIASEPVNGSALGLDLCYMMQSIDGIKVPKLMLVFDGKDAAMELKKHNYFFADNATGLECLTILPSRGGSLLGSLMQTDTNMTYDIDGAQLIFERAFARSPRPEVSLMVVVSLVAWALSFWI